MVNSEAHPVPPNAGRPATSAAHLPAVTEDRVRELVREILRNRVQATPEVVTACVSPWSTHASHARFPVASGRETDGPCFVEPSVGCTHCGFCQSFGH